jgi:hypothetical protein
MKEGRRGLMEVSLLTWHAQPRSVTVMTLFVKNQKYFGGVKNWRGRIKVPPSDPKMGLLSVRVRQSAFLGSIRGLHFRDTILKFVQVQTNALHFCTILFFCTYCLRWTPYKHALSTFQRIQSALFSRWASCPSLRASWLLFSL